MEYPVIMKKEIAVIFFEKEIRTGAWEHSFEN